MVNVGWDTSLLKAKYTNIPGAINRGATLGCCCFAEYDCCCFLDPSTPTWDSGTNFSDGDLSEFGTSTYESLQDSNINHQPNISPSWWLEVSDIVSCGNADWDSVPPFGGLGKTPLFYTITFGGLTFCDITEFNCWPLVGNPGGCYTTPRVPIDANGTFTVQQSSRCLYRQIVLEGCEGETATIGFNPGVSIYFRADRSRCNAHTAFIAAIDGCTIKGTAVNEIEPCDVFPFDSAWTGGQASWRPGTIPQWSPFVNYSIGDQVGHLGSFYVANAAGINHEPPDLNFWGEI